MIKTKEKKKEQKNTNMNFKCNINVKTMTSEDLIKITDFSIPLSFFERF